MRTAELLGEALALFGLPAWVIDEKLVVTYANSFTHTHRDRLLGQTNCKIISDVAVTCALQDTMSAVDDKSTIRSFPVNDSDGNAIEVLHLIRMRGETRALFPDCSAVLTVTPIAPPSARPELLQAAYGLTPAEAEVACRLAMGNSVDQISVCNGKSLNTVRTHLRKVLEKTGCTRQAEAVALLSAFSGPLILGNAYAARA